jgi:hypothetical protein
MTLMDTLIIQKECCPK